MSARKKPLTFAPEKPRYGRDIHRPLNELVVILPLLVFFHLGSIRWGSNLLVPQYLRVVLQWFGATGAHLTALLIVAVLLFQHLLNKDPHRVSLRAVGGIVVESAVWSLPLLAAFWMIGMIVSATANGTESDVARAVRPWLEAVGAGIYEEFLFRMVLLSLLWIVFVDLLKLRKDLVAVASILFSALSFAAVHFTWAQWSGPEPMPWPTFAFLAIAGAWWGVLFFWRGYGVTACCHIWWNVWVILL